MWYEIDSDYFLSKNMEITIKSKYNIWDLVYYRKEYYSWDKLSYWEKQFIAKFATLADLKKGYIYSIEASTTWEISYRVIKELPKLKDDCPRWADYVKEKDLIWDLESTRYMIVQELMDFFGDQKMRELLSTNSIRDRIALYLKS